MTNLVDAAIDGAQTFSEFMENSAKLLSIFGDLEGRDIPDVFEADPYFSNRCDQIQRDIKFLEGLSDEQWERRATRFYHEIEMIRLKLWESAEVRIARLKARISEVETWSPPTRELEGFQGFVLRELRPALEFEAAIESERSVVPTERRSGPEQRKYELEELHSQLESTSARLERSVEFNRHRTQWIRDLRQSTMEQSQVST